MKKRVALVMLTIVSLMIGVRGLAVDGRAPVPTPAVKEHTMSPQVAETQAVAQAVNVAASGAALWVDLLRTGGPFTVAVAAIWFALRKDREARDNTGSHAAELKEMTDEVIALVGASTQAQTELKNAVTALKDGLLALERMIDRRSGK